MIAASGGTIVYSTTIRGDTKTHLLDDIHAALVAAGWDPSAIAGGYQYEIESPQLLGAKVRITAGSFQLIQIQFLSLNETVLGAVHYLGSVSATPAPGGGTYQLWANQCQLFISIAGIDTRPAFYFTAVQGGIPWVPIDTLGVCGAHTGPERTTEAWWSAGDSGTFDASSFRDSFYLTAASTWNGCHNGALSTHTDLAALRLVPKAVALAAGRSYFAIARMQYFGGAPLYLDPLIAWGGASPTSTALVRGELWDAMIPSLPRPLDYTETVCGAQWVNYMGAQTATRWAALYLLLGLPAGTARRGNYVY